MQVAACRHDTTTPHCAPTTRCHHRFRRSCHRLPLGSYPVHSTGRSGVGSKSAHKSYPGTQFALAPFCNLLLPALELFLLLGSCTTHALQLAGGSCNHSAQTQAASFGAFDIVAPLLLSRQQEIMQWACRCLAALVKGSANVRPHSARNFRTLSSFLALSLISLAGS